MMWEACAQKVKKMGGVIRMGCKVVGCHWDADSGLWQITYEDAEKRRFVTQAQHVISSAPMRQLAHGVTPALSNEARRAADALKYRDFLTVMLILKDKKVFDDNWIYIHDPSVKVGRVQNFKSWSPEMVPDPSMNCYGMEYFCFEGDGLWSSTDEQLIEQAKREMEQIGLGQATDVLDGCVVRQPKAYPVYDDDYAKNVAAVRDELEEKYPTLHLIGRNGMHKYNNQDHAMMTAMLCVQNILAERKIYDLWQVNQDAEYHESGAAGRQRTTGATGLRMVPSRVKEVVPG
jgi:protoporphyrinogen oxidase